MTELEARLISDFDTRKFVEEHYEPVEDKPGYVWFSKRNMQIISIDLLVAYLEERGYMNNKKCKLCQHYGRDGYCEELEFRPCYPEKGCDYFSKLLEQEPYDFARWVAEEIFDENWEYNKEAFAELVCRKLAKLGIVIRMGDEWELVDGTSCAEMKIWITTYWTTEIEPVVTPFDNQEAAETCARYYKKQGYKVCIDECNIFHKCTEQAERSTVRNDKRTKR